MTMRLLPAMMLLVAALPARAECVVLEGGQLVLPGQKPSAGTVVIDGGVIVAAGANAAAAGPCRRVAVRGRVVTAGLIGASSTLGVSEIDLEAATREADAGGTDPVRAAFRAADGYNPRSVLIPVARLGGVTSAVVAPSGGLVSGQAAWVDLAGGLQTSAVRRAPVAIFASLGEATGASLSMLRELLDDTRSFARAREAWEKGQSRDYRWKRLDLEALRPVVEGKLPLVIAADRASDIDALIAFAAEEKVRILIRGAAEGHLVAERLAQARVPVIVDPFVYGPGEYDQIHGRPENAARLHAAGVPLVIAEHTGHNLRKLRQLAGNAVRDGLPWEAAFDAITRAPARAFSMVGYGVLEKGAIANVVVWSGDPLEISTQVEQVFVHGRAIELTSRQQELLERYRTLPGTPRAALPLP